MLHFIQWSDTRYHHFRCEVIESCTYSPIFEMQIQDNDYRNQIGYLYYMGTEFLLLWHILYLLIKKNCFYLQRKCSGLDPGNPPAYSTVDQALFFLKFFTLDTVPINSNNTFCLHTLMFLKIFSNLSHPFVNDRAGHMWQLATIWQLPLHIILKLFIF